MGIGLSCSDYTWPKLSHEAVMKVVSSLGFNAVDIGVFHNQTHVTVSAILSDAVLEANRVLEIAEYEDLAIADVFLTAGVTLEELSPTSVTSGDWIKLQEIFACLLEFAKVVGVNGVTLLPGVVEPGVHPAKAFELSVDRLNVLTGIAAKQDLLVSVEPHVGSLIEDPASTLKLLESCPGLSLTLDPSHFGYLGFTVADILPLISRTRHVQIRPAGLGVMQTRFCDNQLDLDLLIAELVRSNYSGWVASEYVWMEKWGCDRVDNTTESFFLRSYLQKQLLNNYQTVTKQHDYPLRGS